MGSQPAKKKAKSNAKRVNLALQGGGAHGAFTWGVLDRLLEDGRLEIEAVSGTSAGAMNAVAMAEGMQRGGPEGARACLRRFWEGVAASAKLGAAANTPFAAFFDPFNLMPDLSARWMGAFLRNTSPYMVNPLNLNPLRDVIEELIDFENVRACEAMQIYIAATAVESGRTRIFEREELTVDHVLASACLPYIFQAVEIEGAPYWDGGYVGNPPLFPFFYKSESRDLIVVQINPIQRPGTPKTIQEILDRVTEITFNASLLREYRNIEFVARLVDEDRLDGDRYRKMLIHRIDGGAAMLDLSAASRLTADRALFEDLFVRGREAAEAWLGDHYDAIGEESSLDIRSVLDNPELGI